MERIAAIARDLASTMGLPSGHQVAVALLMMLPLVIAGLRSSWTEAAVGVVGLAVYLGCLQLPFGGLDGLRKPTRAGSSAVPGDVGLVAAGLAGLAVWITFAIRGVAAWVR
jgi:hypothetical protein